MNGRTRTATLMLSVTALLDGFIETLMFDDMLHPGL